MNLEKKAILVRRLNAVVTEYFEVFGKPIPMKALSAKFGKSMGLVGGFPEAIEELRVDGTLEVVMNSQGGKAVFPAGHVTELAGYRRIG